MKRLKGQAAIFFTAALAGCSAAEEGSVVPRKDAGDATLQESAVEDSASVDVGTEDSTVADSDSGSLLDSATDSSLDDTAIADTPETSSCSSPTYEKSCYQTDVLTAKLLLCTDYYTVLGFPVGMVCPSGGPGSGWKTTRCDEPSSSGGCKQVGVCGYSTTWYYGYSPATVQTGCSGTYIPSTGVADAGPDAPAESGTDAAADSCTPSCSSGVCGAPNGCGGKCPTGWCSDPKSSCSAGSCVCGSGTTLCSGVCIDTSTSLTNCGMCGKTCPSGVSSICSGGSCYCDYPTSLCGSACVDKTRDPYNCGSCGKTCAAPTTCVSGICGCPGVKPAVCSAACVDLDSNPANCGSCGTVCAAGWSCSGAKCIPPATAVTFPSAGSTIGVSPSGLLGSGGAAKLFHTAGDFIEESFSRSWPTSQLEVQFNMHDATKCGTVSWDVRVNGTSVGSFSWVGGTTASDKPVYQRLNFAPIAPVGGKFTIRFVANSSSTTCFWSWIPGGMTTLTQF